MSNIRTLRPGLLVSLNTSIRGNVKYYKKQLEAAHEGDSGEERSSWNTTKVVFDPEEQKAAAKVRDKARTLITGVCSYSAFGLLCPEEDADKLEAAIEEARTIADEFNRDAALTRIRVNALYGRIAQDDVTAMRAIGRELRDLMQDMQTGLAELDVKKVHTAADKARSVGQMLAPEAKNRIDYAIKEARKSARKIVKAGQAIGMEIDRSTIARIESARTAFLDLENEAVAVAAPQVTAAAIEIDFEAAEASEARADVLAAEMRARDLPELEMGA